MPAQKIDLTLDQGSSFLVGFSITDANGSVVDTSTYTANSQMRKTYTSNTSYAFALNTYSNGLILMSMNSSVSNTIVSGRYVYDLEITDILGNRSRIIEGVITVTPQVTR